jgi:hypothetical protein
LLAVIARHGLDFSSDLVERVWEVAREHEERLMASHAAHADRVVSGARAPRRGVAATGARAGRAAAVPP